MNNSDSIEVALAELFNAIDELRSSNPDLELKPNWDFGSRPLAQRPEAGFAVWIPAGEDGTYAGLRLTKLSDGIASHGEAGRATQSEAYHLFDWPEVRFSDGYFSIDLRPARDAAEAAQMIVRRLSELRAHARRI